MFRYLPQTIYNTLTRKKPYFFESDLAICFSSRDLLLMALALAIGNQLTQPLTGVCVSIGLLALPVLLLYSLFATSIAMCYAELSQKMPSCGGIYSFAYYLLGEFIAFMLGWNLIYVAFQGYCNRMGDLSNIVDQILVRGEMTKYLSTDFYKAGIFHFHFWRGAVTFFWGIIGLFSCRKFNRIMKVLVILSLFRYGVLIFSLFYFGKASNLIQSKDIKLGPWPTSDEWIDGLINVSKLFCGFELITHAGCETKKISTDIPIALINAVSYFVTFYMVSTVGICMIVPRPELAAIFNPNGSNDFGEIFWSTNAFGGYFFFVFLKPLPLLAGTLAYQYCLVRILHAMIEDQLIYFPMENKVNRAKKIPKRLIWCVIVVSTLVNSIFKADTSFPAAFYLVCCINYFMICNAAIYLRYRETPKLPPGVKGTGLIGVVDTYFNPHPLVPTKLTCRTARICLCISGICGITLGVLCGLRYFLEFHRPEKLIVLGIVSAVWLISLFLIQQQPRAQKMITERDFECVKIPWVPAGAYLLQIFLITSSPNQPWLTFGIIQLFGLCNYVYYSIRNSRVWVVEDSEYGQNDWLQTRKTVEQFRRINREELNTSLKKFFSGFKQKSEPANDLVCNDD